MPGDLLCMWQCGVRGRWVCGVSVGCVWVWGVWVWVGPVAVGALGVYGSRLVVVGSVCGGGVMSGVWCVWCGVCGV